MSGDKDGNYCTICGGIPPEGIHIRKILIEGKETGIDQLEFIISNVRKLGLTDDEKIAEELVHQVKVFNYVPTKKIPAYKEALLKEYKYGVSPDHV
jgi:hypothetical protein